MGKFREKMLESGTKIILGKDAKNNEELVDGFLGKSNFILHTEAPGSPFCVMLGKPEDKDKEEAAVYCARYSQDWRDRKGDVKVSLFTGKDVHKSKIMPVGTFGVKKQKTITVKKEDILKILK